MAVIQIIYFNSPYAGNKIPSKLLVETKSGTQAMIAHRIEYVPGFVVVDIADRMLAKISIPADMIASIFVGSTDYIDERYQPL